MSEKSWNDSFRLEDVGTIVPAPEGQADEPGIVWAKFMGVYIEDGSPAITPIKVEELQAAGIDLNDPDPAFGNVGFWAKVDLDAGTSDKIMPAEFRPIPHVTAESLRASDHPDGTDSEGLIKE